TEWRTEDSEPRTRSPQFSVRSSVLCPESSFNRTNLLATTISNPALDSSDDIALADRLKSGHDQIIAELRKLIVGQEEVIELVLLSLFTGGNSLVVGVPGLAKTLLINTIAQVLDLKFSRIQFTPDLMPSDITGTDIIQDDPETGRRHM